MANELDLLGGQNPADAKNNVHEGTSQVKALNTGHTEASLKKHMRGELDAAWLGNRGLLGNLFNIFGQIFKFGGQIVPGLIGMIGDLFGGVVEGVTGFVNGVANAITGKGEGGFKAIEGAVDERITPINNEISASGARMVEISDKLTEATKKQDTLVAQQEQTSTKVTSLTTTATDALNRAKTLVDAKGTPVGTLADMQTQLDTAQNQAIDANKQAIEALNENDRLTQEFEREQIRTNRLTQRATWNNQDMIEQVDVRAIKQYGWPLDGHDFREPIPYMGTANMCRAYDTPFVRIWLYNGDAGTKTYIAAKGQWTGSLRVAMNYSGGQLDDYVAKVTDKQRVFLITGGAFHIEPRHVGLQVQIDSLNRIASVNLNDTPATGDPMSGDTTRTKRSWGAYTDANSLIRMIKPQQLRFRNVVKCNMPIFVRNERWERTEIPAGEEIAGYEIYPEDQDAPAGKLTFTEYGTRDLAQFTGNNMPPSYATPVEKIN